MQDSLETYRKPAHVPDELFVPGNIWEDMGADPHGRMRELAAGRDIIYLQSHNHPGHSPAGTWLAVSAEANRQIMMDTDAFPSSGATLMGKMLGGLTFFPVEVEPPLHGKYRSIIAPLFKPAAINAFADKVIARVDGLLDSFAARGECEFVSEFARLLPGTVFLDFMGLPVERADEFLEWARLAMDQRSTPEEKVNSLRRIRDYLADCSRERMEKPTGDTLSNIANSSFEGRPLTVDEATGGAIVLFLAGLDTVANLLGWIFYQLAKDPKMQADLRSGAVSQSRAIEELLRFYSPVTVSRRAAISKEVFGAPIQEGDTVCCSMTLSSRDDDEFDNPDVLDITQPPRRHLVFGYGPHTCIGMHLARLEVKVVMDRWFARIPPFRIADGASVPTRGANVLGIDTLPLIWK